jgi:hypothetical protein
MIFTFPVTASDIERLHQGESAFIGRHGATKETSREDPPKQGDEITIYCMTTDETMICIVENDPEYNDHGDYEVSFRKRQ